jgi:hypothetical protein
MYLPRVPILTLLCVFFDSYVKVIYKSAQRNPPGGGGEGALGLETRIASMY